jgi:ATP-dependent protease ClpP protease subunit
MYYATTGKIVIRIIMTQKQTRIFNTQSNTPTINSDIYLLGDLGEPDNYIEDFQVLSEANEGETVTIHINCNGGYLQTAIQYINHMRESKAHIITVIEGFCHSAATLIFLNGDELQVHPHCLMLVHNYSGGSAGKGGDIILSATAQHTWVSNMMKESYTAFLSEEEISQVLLNQDIWLGSEEVADRLVNVMEYRQDMMEKADQEYQEALKEQVRGMYENLQEDSSGVQEESTEH